MTTVQLLKGMLTATAVAVLPTLASAAEVEVKVENYRDGAVGVCLGYNGYKGDVAAEGWFIIQSGDSRTFTANNAWDLYIRIDQDGKDFTYQGYDKYTNFPTGPGRFTTSKAADDAMIR